MHPSDKPPSLMKRMVVVFAVLLGVAGSAAAQKYEELAKGAEVVTRDTLGALFWASTAQCQDEDDMARRACEGVRQARGANIAAKTFVIDADAQSFQTGGWDAGKTAIPFEVRSCLSCAETIDVGGQRRFIVGRGAVAMKAGALLAPSLNRAWRRFPTEDASRSWTAETAPRLKTEILFRVPPVAEGWSEGEARGLSVEVLGYRTYNLCDGVVMTSAPQSAPLPIAATCGDKSSPAQPLKPGEPELPLTLSTYQIKQGLDATTKEVNRCYQTYGVSGMADLWIDVAPDGHVRDVDLRGEFGDTPTGECVVRAVKKAKLPAFRKATGMNIHYPFMLR
jgi:hypothetical protein